MTKPGPPDARDAGPTLTPVSIGAYRLVAPLGHGGMGEVFLAWDERLKRNVAIKRIRDERSRDDATRDRFRREARAVAQLNHPAIVQVFDVLEGDGGSGDSIVMEHVEGRSLLRAIAAGDLDLLTVVRLAGEIAAGLGEAHSKGLVHRDLKPENVMLTAGPRPRAKILDFGLARALWKEALTNNPGDSLTQSGAVVGTAYAMSPEQANGRDVDHRSDLFSLGNLIYHMLSGEAPFRGESVLDTLRRVHAHHPPPVRRLRPDVPPALNALTMKLLAKDPAGRPANAHLVEEELRRIAVELETAAPAMPAAALGDLPTHADASPLEDAATVPDAETESRVETVVRTLVLTDLVDSTRFVESLGDLRSSEVFARHDRMARDLLVRHDGLEIDKSDGFLLLFRRPFDAVGYILGYHRALAELAAELDVALAARAAVHLGEVVLRHNNRRDVSRGAKPIEVEGLAKPTAARLMSLAGARQTLLSRSAFDLGRRAAVDEERWDENLRWLAHGSYVMKGVDEPVEVFEVGLAGVAPLAAPADSEKARRAVTLSDELVLGWRPAAGQPIPRRPNWTLAERLGEGGFGEVWLALHPSGERRVFKFCFEAERLRGLKREVTLFRLLKEALGHRDDIARILDWSFDEAPYFLEAEYTEGGNLVEWAETQGGVDEVPTTTRLELVAQIADALAAAHSVGILHKDVKPENVLITRDPDGRPRARLTDFGIGLLTDREKLETFGITALGFTQSMTLSDSSAGGTLKYLAPELIEGKPATIQADVYSLGVLLFQMLIGDFSRALAPGWRRDVEDDLVAADLAAMVDGSASRRPGNVAEVAERLRGLEQRRASLQAEQRERRRAAETQRLLEQSQRRRKLTSAIATAGVAVILLVSWLAAEAIRARDSAQRRQRQAENLLGFMLGDLRAKLKAVGRLEILDDVGEQALEYFAAMDEGEPTDEELFRRARAMCQIGSVRLDQGQMDGAREAFEEALGVARGVTQRNPDNAEWHAGLGEAYYWLGFISWQQGDSEDALKWFRRYLEIAERLVENDPDNPDWQMELAYTHSNLGSVLEARGDLEGALAEYRLNLAVNQEVSAAHPQNLSWLSDLASSYNTVGVVLKRMWDLRDAQENHRRELEIRETLSRREPENAEFKLREGRSHVYMGLILQAREQYDEMLAHYEASTAVFQELVTQDPANAQWKGELAMSYRWIGQAFLLLGDVESAVPRIDAAMTILKELVDLEPSKSPWRFALAQCYVSSARALAASGSPESAVTQLQVGTALMRRLSQQSPEDSLLARNLAEALILEGRMHDDAHRREEAEALWNHALAMTTRDEDVRQDVETRALRARALLHLGRFGEAQAIVENLLDDGYRSSELLILYEKTRRNPIL